MSIISFERDLSSNEKDEIRAEIAVVLTKLFDAESNLENLESKFKNEKSLLKAEIERHLERIKELTLTLKSGKKTITLEGSIEFNEKTSEISYLDSDGNILFCKVLKPNEQIPLNF